MSVANTHYLNGLISQAASNENRNITSALSSNKIQEDVENLVNSLEIGDSMDIVLEYLFKMIIHDVGVQAYFGTHPETIERIKNVTINPKSRAFGLKNLFLYSVYRYVGWDGDIQDFTYGVSEVLYELPPENQVLISIPISSEEVPEMTPYLAKRISDHKISKLYDEISKMQGQIGTTATSVTEMKKELIGLTGERLREIEGKISNLETHQSGEIRRLEELIAALKAEIHHELQQIKERQKDQDSAIGNLREGLSATNASVGEIKITVGEIHGDIQPLKPLPEQMADAQKEIAQLKDQLAAAHRNHEGLRGEFDDFKRSVPVMVKAEVERAREALEISLTQQLSLKVEESKAQLKRELNHFADERVRAYLEQQQSSAYKAFLEMMEQNELEMKRQMDLTHQIFLQRQQLFKERLPQVVGAGFDVKPLAE